MPNRVLSLATLLLASLCMLTPTAQEGGDLVVLDVSVVDDKGRAIGGLTARDFVVKEDGAKVDVETFSQVAPNDPDVTRSLVVLMDDVAIPLIGNETMRTVARAIISSLSPRDEVAVVRLSRPTEEAFGDRAEARFRIGSYQPGRVPYSVLTTQADVLHRIVDIAKQLESDDARRKILVCVGAPVVCNVQEPSRSWPPALYPSWVETLGAAARSNVAIYAIIPGRSGLRSGGLADHTGGQIVATSYDLGPAIDRIMQDANHYYLLGYWPKGGPRDLHQIDVKVSRRGARVYARRARAS